MGFQKITTASCCVGGRHPSATKNVYGDITSKGSKVLIGYCSICNRKESMTVSGNTILGDDRQEFFRNRGKKDLMYQNMAKNF